MGRRSEESTRSPLGPSAALLRLMGLWRPRTSLRQTLSAALTLAGLAWLSLTSGLKLLIDPPAELEEIALCTYISTICAAFLIKAAFFIGQGATLYHLINMLSDATRQHSNGKSNEHIRDSYQRLSSRLYYCMQAFVVPPLIGWIFSPLVSHALTASDEETPEADRQFPVPHWIPADMQASPTYEILYVVQALCEVVACESTISVDLFFIHMMLMVAAEMEVLSENVSTMEKSESRIMTSKHEASGLITNDLSYLRDEDSRFIENSKTEDISDNKMLEMLKKNIQHHQAIIQSVALLQEAMDVSIFVLLFTNMADLCASVFATAILLQRDGNVAKVLKPLAAIPGCFYEVAMYCFFGDIVTQKSEELVSSAFSCGWAQCGTQFRRDLLFFLMETVRPVEITVGKTYKLSKQMLLQVLNGFYALLNLLYSTR